MKAICFLLVLCLGVVTFAQVQAADAKLAVVVVDVQADFTSAQKGSLACIDTDQAYLDQVNKATKELKAAGLPIYATQDWHPADHMSFASNNDGKKAFELVNLKDGRVQVMWPNHCVQGSDGAKILIDNSVFTKIVQKGADPKFDSYSGFKDDGGAKTGMAKILQAAGVKTIIVYGIATDYCVQATVLDGLTAGFKVVVVQDLCRHVDPKTAKAALEKMKAEGTTLWPSLDLKKIKKL